MVLQVAAHPGQVVGGLHPRPPQLGRVAHPGQQQQLRRVDSAAAEDNLACNTGLGWGIMASNKYEPALYFFVTPFSTTSMPTAFFPSKSTRVTRTLVMVLRFWTVGGQTAASSPLEAELTWRPRAGRR